MFVISYLLGNKKFLERCKKIRNQTGTSCQITSRKYSFWLGVAQSYSENITEKRSKAIYNHSNENELVSPIVQYVGTSYDKRMILFFDSFGTEIWDCNT